MPVCLQSVLRPPCVVPPNITAPPTALTSTDIPVCCGGVQLNLANPDNPIDVTVLVDGTLHPANQVVRDRDFLYIMGLQAGTEYSLRIALANILGTELAITSVRPLLGEVVHEKHHASCMCLAIVIASSSCFLHLNSSPTCPSPPQVVPPPHK